MNTPRTIYSYGLSNRSRKHDNNLPLGHLFPPLPRSAFSLEQIFQYLAIRKNTLKMLFIV